jgi:hypothetical protein
MVLAEGPASAGEGVLAEFAGTLVVPQRVEVSGEAFGGVQGVSVVFTLDPALAG